MSIRVELSELASHLASRGPGFLLTSVMDSRPHVAHLPVEIAAADGQVQLRVSAGRTARGNIAQRPSVTLLFPAPVGEGTPPPPTDGEPDLDRYSLIVDGEARVDDDEHVVVSVVSAVFHRPVS